MTDVVIKPIPAFTDNYFWCVYREEKAAAVVVDPGAAGPVFSYLERKGLELHTILITHHHADHIGGVAELLRRFPSALVYGPKREAVPHITHSLVGDEEIELGVLGLKFRVIDVPGHTSGHIAYYCSAHTPPILFCGDTLFSVGCGRLFEGTAEQLYASLQTLAALPATTCVYCAHEYTMSNIRFAKEVEPLNPDLVNYERQVRSLREKNIPSLPTTIGLELSVNPFLRVSHDAVMQGVSAHSGVNVNSPQEVFSQLRRWKDVF